MRKDIECRYSKLDKCLKIVWTDGNKESALYILSLLSKIAKEAKKKKLNINTLSFSINEIAKK